MWIDIVIMISAQKRADHMHEIWSHRHRQRADPMGDADGRRSRSARTVQHAPPFAVQLQLHSLLRTEFAKSKVKDVNDVKGHL